MTTKTRTRRRIRKTRTRKTRKMIRKRKRMVMERRKRRSKKDATNGQLNNNEVITPLAGS